MPTGETFPIVTAETDGMTTLLVVVIPVRDVTQTRSAIRHNHPVAGSFRSLFEHPGGFFRLYFFATEREETPFNRARRSWSTGS